MDEPTVIALPERADMERRLLAVSRYPSHVNNLFPFILEHAGMLKNACGVMNIILGAVDCYAQMVDPAAFVRFRTDQRPLIEAIVKAIVNDESVQGEALHLLFEVPVG
ncbi:MAG TPA: hypothetical protein VK963_00900 [Candidatus Saccharimonadales bacterium]|nr:hypothetical protein [Candidatus Saccharimonadales bacterium]